MGMLGRTRAATAAAVVVLALLLQLLAPLPLSRGEATPICTGAGIVVLLTGDGAPPSDHAAGDHCQLCLLPRVDAAPGGGMLSPARLASTAVVATATRFAAALPPAPFTPYAQRAPPAA